jgi:hypothetical protein
VDLTFINEDYDQAEWVYYETIMIPFYAKYFRRNNDRRNPTARPNNFEALKKNEEFLNILSMLARMRYAGLDYYKETMTEINTVIQMIEEEQR